MWCCCSFKIKTSYFKAPNVITNSTPEWTYSNVFSSLNSLIPLLLTWSATVLPRCSAPELYALLLCLQTPQCLSQWDDLGHLSQQLPVPLVQTGKTPEDTAKLGNHKCINSPSNTEERDMQILLSSFLLLFTLPVPAVHLSPQAADCALWAQNRVWQSGLWLVDYSK